MGESKLLIAIDGTAASGKGTLAKRLAKYFGISYLDTGSLYRSLGYKLLKNGQDPSDKIAAIEMAKTINESDLENENLYDEGIGSAASIVSAIEEVRTELFEFQRNFIKNSKGTVLDGRDIGTVICPEANFKFFITANIEDRAKRRYKQLQNKVNSIIYQSVLEDLKRRDERDSQRSIAPLKQAEDAIHIDTTNMSIDEVYNKCLNIIEGKNLKTCIN